MKHIKQYESIEYKKYIVINHDGWDNKYYILRLTEHSDENVINYDKFYFYDKYFVFQESDGESVSKYILDEFFHIMYQSNNLKNAIKYIDKKMEIERDSHKFNL